ncbi:MAG TPA: hypothetical protein VE621_01585 [Bryobacteraceae bacterium]|nr:hypothetical protein [Bryobacteraceae bacterium]
MKTVRARKFITATKAASRASPELANAVATPCIPSTGPAECWPLMCKFFSMTSRTIALLGLERAETPGLERLVAEFGWNLQQPENVASLQKLRSDCEIVAVLFNAQRMNLGWDTALERIRTSVPEALPIVCSRPGEFLSWPDMATAGAFHALLLPLKLSEVRQSLGFVSAARSFKLEIVGNRQSPAGAQKVPVGSEPARLRKAAS